MTIEVGVSLTFDAATYRDRDAIYAQIRTAFEKIEPYVLSQYGVRMEHEVKGIEVQKS